MDLSSLGQLMPVDDRRHERPWMKPLLLAAAAYNLLWGAAAIVFPNLLFTLAGMEPPRYPEVWQAVGMIVGVYGIGYAAAAFHPMRHWPVVLVGFLGKVFGPIGFGWSIYQGTLPLAFGATILTNDLIWWAPFAMILWAAFKEFATLPDGAPSDGIAAVDALRAGGDGPTIAQLSYETPLFLVLLRHAGCTFHREALADLQAAQPAINKAGAGLAVVHMGDNALQNHQAELGGATEILSFADAERRLYQALEIPRGAFGQLFGWREFARGASACVLRGHGVGPLKGDGFQLGGLALISEGRVLWRRALGSASERPDYACEASEAMEAGFGVSGQSQAVSPRT